MKKMIWILGGVGILLAYQNCSKIRFTEESLELASTSIPRCQNWQANKDLLPVEVWRTAASEYNQNMSSPSVADLDGDGIPEVVFSSFKNGTYNDPGALTIASGKNGAIKISKAIWENVFFEEESDDHLRPYSTSQPLLIDLDRDGFGEIVFVGVRVSRDIEIKTRSYYLVAVDRNLNYRWSYKVKNVDRLGASAGDIFQTNKSNVIYGSDVLMEVQLPNNKYSVLQVLDLQSKQGVIASITNTFAYTLSDKVGDKQGLVSGQGVFSNDGDLLFQFCRDGLVHQTGEMKGACLDSAQAISGFPAVADIIPENPGVEIVLSGGGFFHIFSGSTGALLGPEPQYRDLKEHSETTKCQRAAEDGKLVSYVGGGQATIGDFSGKGEPQIAIATGRSLTIFNRRGSVVAGSTTTDCSSVSTGISSFDFNGDGRPEIVYGDEQYLRIYELSDSVLKTVFQTVNPSGTLQEYPIVADVDGDKMADLLVVANNYACPSVKDSEGKVLGAGGVCRTTPVEDQIAAQEITGIRLFKSQDRWMPSRPIWNQGSYFVSNVGYSLNGVFSDNLLPSPSNRFLDSLSMIFKRNIQGNFEESCVK